MKTAIVSAVFGDFDNPNKIPVIDGLEYYLFTDNKNEWPSPWTTIKVTPDTVSPRLAAKKIKLLTHRYLDHDRFFWIDGSILFNNAKSIVDILEEADGHELTFFKHPQRDCIYEEAAVSLGVSKYQDVGIENQISYYSKALFPKHAGLWASGIFIRSNSTPMNNLFEFWFNENTRFSYQDQLSLPVSLRYFNTIPNALSHSLWGNPWFTLVAHKSER